MNNRLIKLILGIVLMMTACTPRAATPNNAATAISTNETGNFTRAINIRPFTFPADMGAHPEFQTEWWYYTGNLESADGQFFGYQLTFFRRALTPADQIAVRSSQWGANQVFMAHFALTDVNGREYLYTQKLQRGAAGLAGVTGDPSFQIWLDDWTVQQTGKGSYHLMANLKGGSLDVVLNDLKGFVLQGDHGLSQKGNEPGNASYYFSQTRLETAGTLKIGNKSYQVNGNSWMDHEFSTSALGKEQVGWDWFALQLDNQTELMLYTIRKTDGTIDHFSGGTLIQADGTTRTLSPSDFKIEISSWWNSPHSKTRYPSGWNISIPSENLTLVINPRLADQELSVSFIYWEGAVEVHGQIKGKPLIGSGYVELTGYAQSMQGQF